MNKTAYINDRLYELNTGETILSFVKRHMNDKAIPTLCDAPNLDPFGACRVCSVDVAMEAGGKTKTKGARAGGMMGVSRAPSMPTGPSNIRKVQKSVRPDPRLPKGKKGKGDI